MAFSWKTLLGAQLKTLNLYKWKYNRHGSAHWITSTVKGEPMVKDPWPRSNSWDAISCNP